MDHRKMETKKRWPWKKKTHQHSSASASENKNKDNSTLVANLDQVKILDEKLNDTMKELAKKDALVKEHSKIADVLITGWENEKAEASNLKLQLESTKLESKEKTAGLDAALKECMKQVRTVKEKGDQKLNDVVFNKTKEWEKIKFELESKVSTLEQELLSCSSQSNAQIEVLKSEIESYKRKVSMLKHEVDVVSMEADIQTQEKIMCAQSMEVVNRQHLEDVQKILNLEAETQRLRSLVLKKLPGPSVLARMKKEVQSFIGDDDTRRRRSPATDMAHRENEILTSRLLAMEGEMNVLKKALSDRETDLQKSSSDNEMATMVASDDGMKDSVSRIPSLWKGTSAYRSMKASGGNSNQLDDMDDMDDFLEMEKLAKSDKADSGGGSPKSIQNEILLSKLQAEISLAFKSQGKKNVDVRKLLTDINNILQNTAKSNDVIIDSLGSSNDVLKKTILQIHDFVVSIEKEAIGTHGRISKHGQRFMEFFSSESNHDDFLQTLSCVLSETKELCSRKFHDGKDITNGGEAGKTGGFTDSSSDSEIHQEPNSTTSNTSSENQLEQRKHELLEADCQFDEVKLQLSDSQKSNCLAVTQLRCMTESYATLESHCQDLQNEINILRLNPETLGNQLLMEEKRSHQDCSENHNVKKNTDKEKAQNEASILQRPRCDSLLNYFISPSCHSSLSDNPIQPKHRSAWSISSNSSNTTEKLGHQSSIIRFFSRE